MDMLIIGDYEYNSKDLIGHGAFAVVFKGRNRKVSEFSLMFSFTYLSIVFDIVYESIMKLYSSYIQVMYLIISQNRATNELSCIFLFKNKNIFHNSTCLHN